MKKKTPANMTRTMTSQMTRMDSTRMTMTRDMDLGLRATGVMTVTMILMIVHLMPWDRAQAPGLKLKTMVADQVVWQHTDAIPTLFSLGRSGLGFLLDAGNPPPTYPRSSCTRYCRILVI